MRKNLQIITRLTFPTPFKNMMFHLLGIVTVAKKIKNYEEKWEKMNTFHQKRLQMFIKRDRKVRKEDQSFNYISRD